MSRLWTALDPTQKAILERRSAWLTAARPDQITPRGSWNTWLILAGRGWGKTRTGAEDVAWYGATHPGVRIAVAAPTAADARDTCVEGDSGLLGVLPPELVETWNRSLGELILTNGARFKTFSADEPDRFRGPQHHRAWADELAAWKYPEAWDQLQFGLRLGQHPQVVATTTPRPTPLIRSLVVSPTVRLTRGSTFDNAANLAPSALAELKARFDGTRLGRQELYAEVLDEAEGALWTREMIDAARHRGDVPQLLRTVVAIDPAATSNPGSDETGIVVAGVCAKGMGWVLADHSGRLSPGDWAARAIRLFRDYDADRIVAEGNQGGEMVAHTIRTQWPDAPVKIVHASRAKVARAEPVAALYEQLRIRHAGDLAALEDQMVTWEPLSGLPSPDRVDALVWAFTDLLVRRRGQVILPTPPERDDRFRRPTDYGGPRDAEDDWRTV